MFRIFVIRKFVRQEFSASGTLLLRNFVISNFVIRNFVRQEFCDQELCTCTPSTPPEVWTVRVYRSPLASSDDMQGVSLSLSTFIKNFLCTEMNKMPMPKPVQYRPYRVIGRGIPEPGCSIIRLTSFMPECRCRRFPPRYRCPALALTQRKIKYKSASYLHCFCSQYVHN